MSRAGAMQGSVANESKLIERSGALLLLLALSVGWALAGAAPGAERVEAAQRLTAQPGITPETAAGIARRETSGRVLSIVPVEAGRGGYRIRLLLDGGRVTTVVVDPRGGLTRAR